MIKRKTWKQFQGTGLLLIINQTLHIFGWAIVLETDSKKRMIAYPARVKFRGFDNKSVSNAYIKLSKYMNKNSERLLKESKA